MSVDLELDHASRHLEGPELSGSSIGDPALGHLTSRSREHAEPRDRGLDGARCGLSEPADRRVAHAPAHLGDQRELGVDAAAGATAREPGKGLLLADGADPAGNALTTGLVSEERRDPHEGARQVDRLVEDHDHPQPERRLRLPSALERERQVELVRRGRSRRRLRRAEPSAGRGHRNAAGQLEELTERRPEGHLVDAGPGNVTRDAEELRPGRASDPDPGERGAAVLQPRRARSRASPHC